MRPIFVETPFGGVCDTDSPGARARGPFLQGDVEDGFPAEGRRRGIRICVTRKTYSYEKMDSGGSPAAPCPRFRRHGAGTGTLLSVEYAHARYVARSAGCDVRVTLSRLAEDGSWQPVAERRTDRNGRIADLLPLGGQPNDGVYRLRFYHIPITMSANGYATYRGN